MLKRDILRKDLNLEHTEARWKSFDGTNLFSQTWQPDRRPRAVINLIHGLGEHSGRYNSWAIKFVEHGFAFRGFDMRGHGQSEGRRGYASAYYKMIRDIESFIEQGRSQFPDIPVFNYGHSLGGNLLLNYIIKQSAQSNGLIITSPWLELSNPPSRFALLIADIVGSMVPWIVLGNRLKAEHISRDLRVVHAYKSDPLVHDRIGIKFLSQIFDAGIRASMSIYKINVPMLVMHGSEDNITSCKTVRNFVRNASDKTTYIEWEGGYHELHNDIDYEEVFDSMLRWLNKQLN